MPGCRGKTCPSSGSPESASHPSTSPLAPAKNEPLLLSGLLLRAQRLLLLAVPPVAFGVAHALLLFLDPRRIGLVKLWVVDVFNGAYKTTQLRMAISRTIAGASVTYRRTGAAAATGFDTVVVAAAVAAGGDFAGNVLVPLAEP